MFMNGRCNLVDHGVPIEGSKLTTLMIKMKGEQEQSQLLTIHTDADHQSNLLSAGLAYSIF